MNLRQLMKMDIEVTSVGRRPQKVDVVASAINVVTQEDFRRSSVANTPEALHMVPFARASTVKCKLLEVSLKALRQILMPRAFLCGLTVLLLLTLQVGPLWAESETSREYTIKAGFIYNFTKFIQWPELAEASIENQGLQFCIAGKDRFGGALDGFSKALKENNRKLLILREVSPKQSPKCHILFIDSSASGQLGKYLEHVKGKPTLVVSDIPGFAEKGVAINFVIRRNKTHFEINPDAVKESGIKISSELLKLGILVGREEEK